MARRTGKLLGISGASDIVDAMVVLVAMETGASVLTSDPVDVGKIVEAVKARFRWSPSDRPVSPCAPGVGAVPQPPEAFAGTGTA